MMLFCHGAYCPCSEAFQTAQPPLRLRGHRSRFGAHLRGRTRALGIRGTIEEGGVAWKGDLESVARANLWLRTASRVLVRVAEFTAKAFFELELHARQIPWDALRGARLQSRLSSHLPEIEALSQRRGCAATRHRRCSGVCRRCKLVDASDADDENVRRAPHQLFVVRFMRDVCTVSADSSGALLHFRGYRQELAKAPLRETLAAAVLARRRLVRRHAVDGSDVRIRERFRSRRRSWRGGWRPGARARLRSSAGRTSTRTMWNAMLDAARAGELPSSPVEIVGADRDAGAIAAAKANAERAGVADDIVFVKQSISALAAAETPGLVVVNPPYGVRVGDTGALKDLYAQLGNVMRKQRSGSTLAVLSADRALERQTKLPLEERFERRTAVFRCASLLHPRLDLRVYGRVLVELAVRRCMPSCCLSRRAAVRSTAER